MSTVINVSSGSLVGKYVTKGGLKVQILPDIGSAYTMLPTLDKELQPCKKPVLREYVRVLDENGSIQVVRKSNLKEA